MGADPEADSSHRPAPGLRAMLAGMDASILIATASLAGVVLLATLIVNVARGIERRLAARMDDLDTRLTGQVGGLDTRMEGVAAGQGEIRERMAKLEGLLEGLREAVTGRRAA